MATLPARRSNDPIQTPRRDSDHWSYGAFVAPDGATNAEIVVRKLRIAPPRFGIGSYVVTVSDDDALRVGREVLRNLGFRGFARLCA